MLYGTPDAAQILVAASIIFGVVTAVFFALGVATTFIARARISYVVIRALAVDAFWSVPHDAVVATATAFATDLAIAGSLLLFLGR